MIQMFNMKTAHPMCCLGKLLFNPALLSRGFVALEKHFATLKLCFSDMELFKTVKKVQQHIICESTIQLVKCHGNGT